MRLPFSPDPVYELRSALAEEEVKNEEGRLRLVQTQHGVERLVDWSGLNAPDIDVDLDEEG